jgi:hypothetical protein
MKLRFITVALVAALAFTGCSSNEATTPTEDKKVETEVTTTENDTTVTTPEVNPNGEVVTFLIPEDPSGESTDEMQILLTYENGKVTDVFFDIYSEDGTSKRELSANGGYAMGGEFEWYEQIDKLQDFLKANNFDTSKVTIIDESGHTDAISGVSINVKTYVDAIATALSTPIETEDESLRTFEMLEDESGEKKDRIVVSGHLDTNGKPTDLYIDVITEDGTSKRVLSANGQYDMGGELEWYEQIDKLQEFIIANDFDLSAIALNDEGATDSVSGVSITVARYVIAVEQYLASIQ